MFYKICLETEKFVVLHGENEIILNLAAVLIKLIAQMIMLKVILKQLTNLSLLSS